MLHGSGREKIGVTVCIYVQTFIIIKAYFPGGKTLAEHSSLPEPLQNKIFGKLENAYSSQFFYHTTK